MPTQLGPRGSSRRGSKATQPLLMLSAVLHPCSNPKTPVSCQRSPNHCRSAQPSRCRSRHALYDAHRFHAPWGRLPPSRPSQHATQPAPGQRKPAAALAGVPATRPPAFTPGAAFPSLPNNLARSTQRYALASRSAPTALEAAVNACGSARG